MVDVAGRSVTDFEFAVLDELADGDDTARSIAINVIGGTGWKVLRALTSLEARRLVERYSVDAVDVVAWRLTQVASECMAVKR